MRRSVTRCLVSLWTLWFALIRVGPGGFGACPEHGSGGHDHASMAPPMPTAAIAHDGSHEYSLDASQHMHHAMPTGDAPSDEAPPAHHQCTCLGACCMMAPSALPASTELLLATISTASVSPTPAYRTVIAARRVFSQPYAIGPPAAPIA